MDSMVERVARAILQEELHSADTARWDMSPVKDFYLRLARAAIEAMRLPNLAMVQAALDKCRADNLPVVIGREMHTAEEIYMAMITAALEPQADVRVAEGRPAGPSANKE